MIKDKYICECCGGRINRLTMTCEYCGTQYKEEFNNVIRLETYQNPIREFKALFRVTDEMIHSLSPKEISELAIRNMSNELAKSIAPFCEYKQEHDFIQKGYKITSRIKIVQPNNEGIDRLGEF